MATAASIDTRLTMMKDGREEESYSAGDRRDDKGVNLEKLGFDFTAELDSDNDEPPPGWTKSKSEWEWEQARHNRLKRVAQKIKTPAKKEKVQPGATQPDDTSPAASMSTVTASSEAFPEAPTKKIAPPPPTPKEVGIGMKIGEPCPHEVTGFAKGGAAAECGLISEGDKLLQVDRHDVTNVSM